MQGTYEITYHEEVKATDLPKIATKNRKMMSQFNTPELAHGRDRRYLP